MTEKSNRTAPETVRIQLDPCVTFSDREIAGRTVSIAHHAGLAKYFQFGIAERRIAELLDGQRDIRQVVEQLNRDGIAWKPEEIAKFISQLVAAKLARVVGQMDNHETSPPANASATKLGADESTRRGPPHWLGRLTQFLSMTVSQRFPLFDGRRLAERLERRMGWCFDLPGLVAWALLVSTGWLIVCLNVDAFTHELQRIFDRNLWWMLIVIWCLAKALHESGHAVAAHHRGVRVGKVGVLFFLLAPLAYVDVTDAWKLRSRWQRVQIALAGVYLEMAVAAMAAWAWYVLPVGSAQHLAAQLFLIAGPASLLVNANPLLRLDGYYVLSDLTEIPNLRMHGRKQLAAHLERLILRIPQPPSLLRGWRRTFATVHAACSVVFQFFWMAGLIVAVSYWAGGLGVLLAASALILWALLPLSRWVYKVWTAESATGSQGLSERRKRLIAFGSLLLFAASYLATATSPFDRRVPVIVRFRDEQIVRAGSDAFVRNVHVQPGQRVRKGTILIEMEAPRLRLRRDELEDDLELASSRAIQRRRNDQLAEALAESEHAKSLQRQLAELDEQLSELTVVARRSGIVIGTRLENLEGRFVARGDELFRVADPREKELLVAVSESNSGAFRAAATRQRHVKVRLRGGNRFEAVTRPLQPRASRHLLHPALASTSGGPVAVEPAPEEEAAVRAVQPHLQCLIPLNPLVSMEVHAGQLGSLNVSDDRPLVSRLFDLSHAKVTR